MEQCYFDDFLLPLSALKLRKKRNHRFWVHEILKRRKGYGAYYHLVKEPEFDREKYKEYFRMTFEQLEILLSFVGPLIQKQCVVRESIDEKQRLVMCIRFLASGETYTSLATQYRVGVTTLSRIVPEVCETIWVTLQEHFMSFPKSAVEWEEKAVSYQQRWDYPHCVGAIDGKHVVIEAPANSGSLYYNYKHSFSMVLLAMVDADYKFVYVDTDAYGKQ
ncbi:protein antagonist of like heterochromatin protein 1 [Plakobranchus ocellatus]|uniref:Protein antagonist of like heterochromatin protein 1 n=1 Tax=Plakobranchus ocellatus TaxID=259542 RepID=A0AAV4DT83_9GAST|nr:protein antagonist of like heterochromatin protein 1 [Plakobranchus ocellatus]